MTGRELIIYILENHLENEEIFKNDEILGLMVIEEAAAKTGVGVESINAMIKLGWLKTITVGDKTFVLATDIMKKEGVNT
jgi:hypothetical protein